MRKLLLLLFALTTFFSVNAQEDLKRTLFKISPQHFGVQTMMLGAEFLNPTLSKSLEMSLGVSVVKDDYSGDVTGGFIELQYRSYLVGIDYIENRPSPFYHGIYAGVFLQGGYYNQNSKWQEWDDANQTSIYHSQEDQYASIFPGFVLGIQRIYWEVMSFELYVGGGVRLVSGRQEIGNEYYGNFVGITDFDYVGIMPKMGFKIGVTF